MSCLVLFMHPIPCALVFALANAGKSMPARMAMMAITTSSSIKVNAVLTGGKETRVFMNVTFLGEPADLGVSAGRAQQLYLLLLSSLVSAGQNEPSHHAVEAAES